MIEQKLLTEQEAADLLNVQVMTLRRLRYKNKGPKYIKVGRLFRYEQKDLDEFINQQKRGE
jgi:excisionase family DNA binding protein